MVAGQAYSAGPASLRWTTSGPGGPPPATSVGVHCIATATLLEATAWHTGAYGKGLVTARAWQLERKVWAVRTALSDRSKWHGMKVWQFERHCGGRFCRLHHRATLRPTTVHVHTACCCVGWLRCQAVATTAACSAACCPETGPELHATRHCLVSIPLDSDSARLSF